MPPTRETNPIALNNLIGLVGQSSNCMRMVANAGQVTAGVARHLIQTQDNVRKQGGGSKPGKAANIERDRDKGHAKLVRDYSKGPNRKKAFYAVFRSRFDRASIKSCSSKPYRTIQPVY